MDEKNIRLSIEKESRIRLIIKDLLYSQGGGKVKDKAILNGEIMRKKAL